MSEFLEQASKKPKHRTQATARMRHLRQMLVGLVTTLAVVLGLMTSSSAVQATVAPVAPSAVAGRTSPVSDSALAEAATREVLQLQLGSVSSAAVANNGIGRVNLIEYVQAAAKPSSTGYGAGIFVNSGPHLKALEKKLFLGQINNVLNGVLTKGYCYESGKKLKSAQVFVGSANIPGVGHVLSQQVEYILSTWGNTTSLGQLTSVSAAVKALIDVHVAPDWTTWYKNSKVSGVPPNVYAFASKMIASARVNYGSHKVVVTLKSSQNAPVYVGQIVYGTVTVPNYAKNRLTINTPIRFVVSGGIARGALPKNTGPNGVAHFTITDASPGGVKVSVYAILPQSTKILVTTTSQQRLVHGYPTPERVVGSASIRTTSPGKPAVNVNCGTSCNGAAPVSIKTDCNPKGAALREYLIYDTNLYTKAVVYRGGINVAGGSCGAQTIRVADMHAISIGMRYYFNGRWSGVVMFGGRTVVHCVAEGRMYVSTQSCCNTAPTIVLTLQRNTTGHIVTAQVADVTYSSKAASHQVGFLRPGAPTQSFAVKALKGHSYKLETTTYNDSSVGGQRVFFVETVTF